MPRPTSSTPTTARAVPLLVPMSASVPDRPPTINTRPTMMLLMRSSEAKGRGTIGTVYHHQLWRPSLPDIITYPSTTSHMRVHVSTFPRGKNQLRINIVFSTCDVDSGQTAQ